VARPKSRVVQAQEKRKGARSRLEGTVRNRGGMSLQRSIGNDTVSDKGFHHTEG
jgi:hypothetical protein